MRRVISSLLAMVGLAPARRCAALEKQVRQLKADVADWKTRATRATERAKTMDHELKQYARTTEKLKRSTARVAQQQGELDTLRARLEQAERDLAGARDHLMVIEVKLDILEGAANVLDARTRSALARAGQTGVPA